MYYHPISLFLAMILHYLLYTFFPLFFVFFLILHSNLCCFVNIVKNISHIIYGHQGKFTQLNRKFP